MQLTREKGQRMWGGGGSSIAGGGGGGGTSLAGYATESWVDDNYLSKEFWNQLFVIHTSTTTTVKDSGGTIISGPTTVNTTTLDPNTLAGTTETTDEETGNVTTVTVAITSIEAKKGLWTNFFLSALGQNASGTGGVLSLNDLVDVEISNPQSGEVLKYNGSKWVNGTGGGGGGSTAWADITGKPTTIAGYGITDAKIVSGTIYLGSSSITPITTETDPTVPAWAKTPTKPSYSFSELTSHPTTLSGYGITDAYTKSEVYTKTETDERFLTIAFFSRLFQAKNGSTNVNPNDTTSTIDNIKALFGFWTDQYISALGQNSSGGGGGGSSTLAGLNDVQLGTLNANDVLTYDGNGHWVNTSKSTFLSGYATQAWVGQQNYLTTETDPTVPAWAKASTKPSYSFSELTSHPTTLSGYGITDAYTKSEVYNKTEADERFLTIAFFSRLFQAKNGSTNVNPNDTTSTIDNIKALFGFWTDQYLSALGQNSSGGGGGGGSSTLAGLNDVQLGTLNANDVLTYDGNGHWVNTSKSTFLSGYATQTWVGQQNYLTSVAFVDLTSHPTTLGGYGITDAYISSGTIYLGSNSITPVTTETDPTVPAWAKASTKPSYSFSELTSHPTTLSGYGITDAVNISTTWWGQSIVNGTVTGNLSSVGNITMSESIVGLKSLEFNTSGELQGYGGFLDFHYNGSLADFTSRIIEETSGVLSIQAGDRVLNETTGEYEFVGKAPSLVVGSGYNNSSIVIGNGKLVWDETNNSLKVIRSNGSAANIYATGGVSALGMQAGVSVLDAMTFNYVAINNNLEFGAASRITHAVINDDRTLYIGNSDNSGWVGLADMCSQAGSDKWYIYAATGEASFMTSVRSARFYLDSSRYLYLDGSNNLMFYNGSTPKQVAFVN